MVSALGTIPASDKIGSFPLWDWLINCSPGYAFIIMALLSPLGYMFILRPFVEGRLVLLRDEFLTFRLDIMFAPALGIGLVLVGAMGNHPYVYHSTTRNVVQVLILLLWIGFGAFHAWQERGEYTWKQRLSPTALYHNVFLFGFVGYLLTMVCGMGLLFAPWSFEYIVLRVVMLICVLTWGLAWPLWDEKHKLSSGGIDKYEVAHVEFGWPWQHHYAGLRADWDTYWADLKGLPGRMAARLRQLAA